MNSLIKIGSGSIAVKEYRGQRVVTFKEIDECHGRPDGTARKRFNDNRKHMVKGTDFFVRKTDEAKNEFGIAAPNGLTLITESGYLMLVKSFTDDLAWDVQRQLVNTYFRRVPADETLKTQMQQERTHAMMMNAKTRALKLLMQTIGDKHLTAIAAQVFGITSIEEVSGDHINYRPECGQLYSADDLAKEVGSNRITVGKRATAAGIKTEEYGITVLSKSEHSAKQVPTFMYNEAGRAAVKALFNS